MRKTAYEMLYEAFEKINATGMSPVEKTSFEMLDEAIEKIAERDNKRVTGNAAGAMLLGAGGAGLYSANKDKAIAEAAAKKARAFKNNAKLGASLVGANILGTGVGVANEYKKGKPLGTAVKRNLDSLFLTGVAGAGTARAVKKQKASQALANKALKNSKLKGAAGIAGLGLGAGTLLAANKKKD